MLSHLNGIFSINPVCVFNGFNTLPPIFLSMSIQYFTFSRFLYLKRHSTRVGPMKEGFEHGLLRRTTLRLSDV